MNATKWPKPDLYKNTQSKFRYGRDDTTYRIAGQYLSGAGLVEDWGCGTTYAREFIGAPYRGIDGAMSKWASEKVELTKYKSQVPKILMRHVLEHNIEWRQILENMLQSFTDRAVLILFTQPSRAQSKDCNIDPANDIPTFELCEKDLNEILFSKIMLDITMEEMKTDTAPYGYECMYFIERK